MIFRSLSLTFLFLLVVVTGIAQNGMRTYLPDPGLTPREHTVDMQHMKVEVAFAPKEGKVEGTVTHTFQPLRPVIRQLELDAPDIDIQSATLGGQNVRVEPNGKTIIFHFDKDLEWDKKYMLTIQYEAHPKKGIYFVGWNQEGARKQIWTQGQGTDNRHWIPCYDSPNDKLTTEMIVEFDTKYKVLSNGNLLSQKEKGDKTVWHYKMTKPHTTYLVMLGIGDYAIEQRQSASGVPISLWYYPDWKGRVEPTYRYSAEMMDWFEQEIGVPYPWETYAQIPVQEFLYGAMENTTATIFGDFFMVDNRGYNDRNYVAVNAHELAHQWFGDMVTARSGAHHWLQESFATYYNYLYEGEAFGQDHFDWQRRRAQEAALNASKKDQKGVGHSQGGVTRHYPKGAFVLSMLRYVVGDAEYRKSIQHYLNKHAYQNVDSEDLLVAFHETLGLSLDWFWDQWVYRGGEPHYKVRFETVQTTDGQEGRFTVEQVQEQKDAVGLFSMPIVFEVHLEDGAVVSERITVDQQTQTVALAIPDGKKVAYALFDPNNLVLKKVDFEKPTAMLIKQAAGAKYMLDRYDAVVALDGELVKGDPETIAGVYRNERFFAVKGEIVKQVLRSDDEKLYRFVEMGINSGDPKVREAALKGVAILPASLIKKYEVLLNDPSYDNQALALRKLCLANPGKASDYLEATKDAAPGVLGQNFRIAWLECAIAVDRSGPYLEQLVALTGPGYEFRTRVNAAQALQRANHLDKTAMNNLFEACLSFNSRLRGPCKTVLLHFYAQNSFKSRIRKALKEGDWPEADLKKLNRMFGL